MATGWDNGLCQDYCRGLSLWFSSRLDARHTIRKHFMTQPNTQAPAVRVCPHKDIVCGDKAENWCNECPNWPGPTSSAWEALRTISTFPITEQDNLISANMRQIARIALRAALASQPAQPAPVAVDESARLSDFQEGQWWVKELDDFASSGVATPDQKRAVAVVHHMLRSARSGQAYTLDEVHQALVDSGYPDHALEELLQHLPQGGAPYRSGQDGGDAGGEIGTLTITSTPSGTRMLSTSFDWHDLPDGTHKLFTTQKPAAVSVEGVDERALRDQCKQAWLNEPDDCTILEAYDRGWKDGYKHGAWAAAPAATVQAGQGVMDALIGMLDAFTNPESGEVDRRLAIKDARAALAASKERQG